MVWVPLANGDGQVVKGIKLKHPETGKVHTVVSTSRKGINRYEITFDDGSKVMNHEIRKKKGSDGWSVVGGFHSPEEIAKLYGRKLDPDANLPRPMRASFWKMKSKPGTHNYRQKKKLMQDPVYIKKFSQFFKDTLDESAIDEATMKSNKDGNTGSRGKTFSSYAPSSYKILSNKGEHIGTAHNMKDPKYGGRTTHWSVTWHKDAYKDHPTSFQYMHQLKKHVKELKEEA